jgi:hypothetical protein
VSDRSRAAEGVGVDGCRPVAYQTAHLVAWDGKIARWTEHPGSMREFEAAWGPR